MNFCKVLAEPKKFWCRVLAFFGTLNQTSLTVSTTSQRVAPMGQLLNVEYMREAKRLTEAKLAVVLVEVTSRFS